MPNPTRLLAFDLRPRERRDVDLLVVGGGAAGLAAATVAARKGLRVALIEKYGFCGGGAVAGLSGTICGLYQASKRRTGPGAPLVRGFVSEFVEKMETSKGLTPPIRYGNTFTRVHDPLVWRHVADALLMQAEVEVHLHSCVIDVLVEGGERIAGAIATSKSGRVEFRAEVTIDASGDGDIVAMAGLPFTEGDDGHVQNPTMMFRMMGVDVPKFRAAYGDDSIMPETVREAIEAADARGRYYLPRSKIFLFPTPRPGELLCNATRIVGRDGRELNTTHGLDLTEAEIQGRRQVREYSNFIRDHLDGCAAAYVNDSGVQVGVRQTRSITGVTKLTNKDVQAARKRSDGIARSAWPIELHSGEKPHLNWLLDDYYEVPYGAFIPARGESLLVAGRCLSAEHAAMASARVTAQCFAYGEAVGNAAVLAIREKVAAREIPGETVRAALGTMDAH